MVTITTFGHRHGPPPQDAHLTVDLRRHFRDPHLDKRMRYLTAHDTEIRAAVLSTPGIYPLLEATKAAVLAYQVGRAGTDVHVAVGCAGGRHRAATFGMTLAAMLEADEITVELTHRDLVKEVADR